ncbi:MAG: hypothetical protein LBH25_01020 [Fibromonadaceae bacterium]|nr:hypothetical protein [Fibromonadaceae bacterium]
MQKLSEAIHRALVYGQEIKQDSKQRILQGSISNRERNLGAFGGNKMERMPRMPLVRLLECRQVAQRPPRMVAMPRVPEAVNREAQYHLCVHQDAAAGLVRGLVQHDAARRHQHEGG